MKKKVHKNLAIVNYQKAFGLDPADLHAFTMQKQLEKGT